MSPHSATDSLATCQANWADVDRIAHLFGLRYHRIIGPSHSLVCDVGQCGATSEVHNSPDQLLAWAVHHLINRHQYSPHHLLLHVLAN